MIFNERETFGSLGNHNGMPVFEGDWECPTILEEWSSRHNRGNYESCFARSIEWQT